MNIYRFDDELPKELLRNGGIIAFPTETVFGLGVRFDRKDSFERLIKVKERPEAKPFTIMLGRKEQIFDLAYVDDRQRKVIETLLPGELTIILKKKPCVPDYVTLGGDTIGLRVPGHERLRLFLDEVGVPLLVPSANKSGESPAKSVNEIIEVFKDKIDCVVDGTTGDSIPSTVVSLIGERPAILRQGKITKQEIDEVFFK